jgi:glycosyltransferase involved in cell wall biosynthesis
MRPSIAVAMIVKNEAENLRRVVDSVKDCVDAVYITDTGSTDGTVEIAKSLGAHVSHFEWVKDFARARNASFEPVKEDYVMWIDGDDVLENQDQFKLWRDNVMMLADYWIATYHYALDAATGKPVCSFARERVLKRSMGFRWRYFVHEGVPPISMYGIKPKINVAPFWSIKHLRTQADLEKDKSRNLELFEAHKSNLDTRMTYYWGKELFEQKQPVEAIPKLLDSCTKKDLEHHDRMLGYQYCAMAYMQCNQYEKAIDVAMIGVQLEPNRAEYHCIIADSYLKIQQPAKAIPFYYAAMNCQRHGAGLISAPLFTQENLYSTWPRNQLARIYAQSGQWDRAQQLAEESVKLGDTEARKIYDEITTIRSKITSYSQANAKPCDDIVITTPPVTAYEWDADIAKTRNMGGSEWAAIQMAEWLQKVSGRRVRVFNMRNDIKTINGVEYLPASGVHEYFGNNVPYVHIAWRHNNKLTDAPTFLWCHDLQTPGAEAIDRYRKILALTPFHKRYLMATQGLPEEKILVTRNGIVPERFMDGPWEKDPNRLAFTSSPDRGLDRAIRVVEMVRERGYKDLQLHVYYGIEHLDRYGLGELRIKLQKMMQEREWVIYHGATQQDVMTKDLKSTAVWIHPCDWVETSCITALEMVCAGVYPVTRRLGGLMDTLSEAEGLGMATLLNHDCVTEGEFTAYADALQKALDEKAWTRVNLDPRKYSWEGVAREWLEEFPKHF